MRTKAKSGASAKQPKPYKYDQQMSFLLPVMVMRHTSGNLPNMEEELRDDDGSEDNTDPDELTQHPSSDEDHGPSPEGSDFKEVEEKSGPQVTSPDTQMQRKRIARDKYPRTASGKNRKRDPFEEAIINAMQKKAVAEPKVADPDEMFLLSLLPTIRRLSDQQKSSAKIKIQQLLHDIEFPPASPLHVIPPQPQMHQNMSYGPAEESHHAESPNFNPFMPHPLMMPRQTPTSPALSSATNSVSEASSEELSQASLSGQGATGGLFIQQLM